MVFSVAKRLGAMLSFFDACFTALVASLASPLDIMFTFRGSSWMMFSKELVGKGFFFFDAVDRFTLAVLGS